MQEMERLSGVSWGEVQAAMARVNVGDNDVPELEKEVSTLRSIKRKCC